MRSFSAVAWVVVVVGGVDGAAVLRSPSATITPAPSVASPVVRRDGPDAVSVAEVLLTAVPESIREVAATNAAAASTILWEEFLDDSRPEWFLELPYDIQTYLISKFGPATAVMPTPTGSWLSQATEPTSNQASETTQASDSQASSAFSWPQPSQSSVATEFSSASQSTTASQSASAPRSSGTSQSSGASRASSGFSTSIATATNSITNPIASPTNPTATGSASAVDPSSDPSSNPTSSSTSTSAPGASGPQGLTKKEKIGLGVGIPLGLLGAAAIAFAIILLCRRRRQKKINGSIPPSSPGFIPRFSFMEKAGPEPDQLHPLNRPSAYQSFHDLNNMTWEDEPFDPSSSSSDEIVPTVANQGRPIMAPALYHTHSSNRARGKRTSYQSLQSVTEVTEPDEEAESPILGRHTSPRPHPSPKQPSPTRKPLPSPPIPAAAQIKRKPVPSINSAQNPAAQLASESLLRQTMPDYSSPYSHDPPTVFGASFANSSSSSSPRGLGNYTSVTSNPHPDPYVSPIEPTGSNPFSNSYSYEEDYGPEYATPPADDRFEGIDGLYGGNQNLSRYPQAKHSRSGSGSGLKTEWPLRNFTNSHKRNKSPLWDRVYES